MARLDFLLFGYYRVKIQTDDIIKASDILLKAGISTKIDSHGRFTIAYMKRSRIEELFCGKVSCSFSQPKGVLGAFIKNRYRVGVFFGILFMAFIFFFSSDLVWDVRIVGAEAGEESVILKELSEAGLSVGKRWSKIEKNKVEITAISSSDTLAWVNVNRRGTVAYVTVERKTVHQNEKEPSGYASIVALRDCVIEEIIVEKGYAMVKKGESVRAGEVLISGVIPDAAGGGFCYAEGTVKGRYPDTLTVSTDREISQKVYGKSVLHSAELIIFGKELNIFKRYGQLGDQYDIIEKTEELTLGKRLPISVNKSYLSHYTISTVILSDEQLVSYCSEKFREELNLFLSDKEAKKMSVWAEFFDGGYRMSCDMVICTEVSKIQEFKVE